MAGSAGRRNILAESHRLADEPDRAAAVLSNGMTVIVQRCDAAPVASIRAYIRAGSAFEGRLLGSGISHLLEHVVTGGATQRREESAVMAFGDAIGGLNNAYTSVDHMCYHVTVQAEHLAEGLELVSDWVARPTLSREVFDREMGVVRREWEADRDDPQTQLDELLYEVVYRNHPMGLPVIGRADLLACITYPDLIEHHRRTHAPASCILVIAGRLDPEKALKAAREAFAGFEGSASPPVVIAEPSPISAPVRAIRALETDSATMVLAWLTVREGSAEDVALDLLCSVLTEGDSARLVRDLRWNRGLVFDIAGTHESLWHTPGTLRVSAQLEATRMEEVERLVIEAMENLRTDPVSDHELERARRQNIVAIQAARQTAESYASQLGLDFLSTGSVHYSERYLELMKAVTPEDLRRVAGRYLAAHARATIAIVPKKRSAKRAASAPGTPSAAHSAFVLDNGLRCSVRRMPETPFVALNASFLGGVRAESDETSGMFNLLAEVMPRGTAARSAEQISEAFEGLGSYLRSGSGADSIGMEFASLTEDWQTLVEIMGDVAKSPALAQEQIEIVRPSIVDAIMRIDEEWHTELGRLVRQCFFSKSPYRRITIGDVQSVERLTSEDLRRAHGEAIHAGGVLSIAGNIDPDQVREVLNRCFGTLPPAPSGDCVTPSNHTDPPPSEDRLFVKRVDDDRHSAAIFVGYPGCSMIDREARAPLAILGAVLAGYALSGGRLFAALRSGKRDMVYEVAGSHFAGMLPGFFGVTAACESKHVTEVYETIQREIGELRAGRVADEELLRAKAMVHMAELEQMQTSSDHARRDGFDELCGLGVGDSEAFLREISATSLESMLEAARRFLTHATVVIVTPNPGEIRIGLEPRPINF